MAYIPKFHNETSHRVLTIKEFVEYVKNVELNPIEQRLDVQAHKKAHKGTVIATKSQSIIGDIFHGLYTGELCVYILTEDDIELGKKEFVKTWKHKPKSIHDGGHRARTIVNFIEGKFPTHKSCQIGSKYYFELTADERTYFENYKVLITEFTNSSPEFRGYQFHKMGMSTSQNHQEILNGFGNIPVANMIRKAARSLGDGIDNRPHSLFEILYSDTNAPSTGRYLNKNGNTRMSYDRWAARGLYCTLNNGVAPCDDDELQSMYVDKSLTREKLKKYEKEFNSLLDFVFKIAEAAVRDRGNNHPLTFEEATMLKRLYFSWKADTGVKISLHRASGFWDEFSKAYSQATNDVGVYDKNMTNGAHFRSKLRTHKSVEDWHYTVDVMDRNGFTLGKLVEKDIVAVPARGKATFPKNLIYRKWLDNNRKDCIDGQALNFADAEGAHIVPRSKGGTTAYSNLEVTSRVHNRTMGSMNLWDYKAMIDAKRKI